MRWRNGGKKLNKYEKIRKFQQQITQTYEKKVLKRLFRNLWIHVD